MLKFNNFRMVNEIELVSKSQSLKSLKSLTGFKGSSSLFISIIDVHCSC